MWYIAHNSKMFKFSEQEQSVILNAKQDIASLGRVGYFNLILPVVMRFP